DARGGGLAVATAPRRAGQSASSADRAIHLTPRPASRLPRADAARRPYEQRKLFCPVHRRARPPEPRRRSRRAESAGDPDEAILLSRAARADAVSASCVPPQ